MMQCVYHSISSLEVHLCLSLPLTKKNLLCLLLPLASATPDPPSAVPFALPVPPPSASFSRRLPLLCYSLDETRAVNDTYRYKWYSLGRSNLNVALPQCRAIEDPRPVPP